MYNGQIISYEITGDGYNIFLGSREIPWISQHEPGCIPYAELGYEGACLKHIEEITAQAKLTVELEPRVAELEKTVGTILGKEGAV